MDARIQELSPHSHQPDVQRSTSAILPLPTEVIAQIKSSVTITSLTAAILGLVQNSLDARATKIDIDVDFRRGGCVVEDDGLGILPTEFAERGGLGKLYHTSKYKTVSSYGSDGIFLSSLASLCLLNVISHHHQHRSTNSVTFHHSKAISRLVPAPSSHHLDSRDHGTKVSVRDLFGNMPVRVKQRSLSAEDRTEQENLWESLKQSIVALLVASGRHVAIKLKDRATSKSLVLTVPKSRSETLKHAEPVGPGQPEGLRRALSILLQAGLVSPGTLKSWVPASASSRSIVLRGGICLEPAPSKATQFLSLGIRPLSRSGHNELYGHINRLFSRSQFGTIEPEPLTKEEKLRRQRDRRFKHDGLTNKQLLAEKGVDRWPMFVLSISFKDDKSRSSSEALIQKEANLSSVINVLDALITGWLSANHFCPRKRKAKHQDSLSPSESDSESVTSRMLIASEDALSRPGIIHLTHREKRPKSSQRIDSPSRSYTGVTSMNELSRIKCSNRSLLETPRPNTYGSKRLLTVPTDEANATKTPQAQLSGRAKSDNDRLAFLSELSGQYDLRLDSPTNDVVPPDDNLMAEEPALPQDAVINWIDPITKKSHRINSRTGAIVAPKSTKPHDSDGELNSQRTDSQNIFTRSLRLPARKASIEQPSQSSGWLDNVLQNWQNPVFRGAEKWIPKASLHMPGDETGAFSVGKFDLTTVRQIENTFKEVSHLNANRISKEALENAQIISQVDNKFILVAMASSQRQVAGVTERTMLVVIDQHAADERCKVEQLLDELSKPVAANEPIYTSTLGHKSRIHTSLLPLPLTFRTSSREAELFRGNAGHFANWGVLYDLGPPPKDSKVQQYSQNLIVRSVPPVIAERCKIEPKVLISLLRTEVWKLVENNTKTASSLSSQQEKPLNNQDKSQDWIRRIGSFPRGILEMVNSRACRSAIMFNDELKRRECEDLVKRLARCAFPFQCAHGRPSMVPLLDLGLLEGASALKGFGSGRTDQQAGNFVKSFLMWRDSVKEKGDEDAIE